MGPFHTISYSKKKVAMANKTLATLYILSLLSFASLANGCFTCGAKRPPPPYPYCPRDTLKLGVCLDLLGLVGIVVGSPPTSKCCALLDGLADLEVAICLCTVIKANVLGINLDVPVALTWLLNACEKKVPPGFQCE